MTGDLRREHWIVPVRGLTHTDPDGTVAVIARRDGTVILQLACGDSRTAVRFDVCRAAQLSTGIWEAAGASQQLTDYPDGDEPPPPVPGDLPVFGPSHSPRNTPADNGSPMRRPRMTPIKKDATREAMRTIGLRIRRIREARGKSQQVIAELIGMSGSTLHHIEHGRRELTLSETAALAYVLRIAPAQLIVLPILTELRLRS